MRHDAAAGGAVPTLSGRDILAATPGIDEVARVEPEDWGRFPGPHMTPERQWSLRARVAELLARDEVAGVVLDARHRHHGGDGVSVRALAPRREAGGVHRCHALGQRSRVGRTGEPARCRSRRRQCREPRLRCAGGHRRARVLRTRRDEGAHAHARRVREPRTRAGGRGGRRPRDLPARPRRSRGDPHAAGARDAGGPRDGVRRRRRAAARRVAARRARAV